jgi:hypothetical protein
MFNPPFIPKEFLQAQEKLMIDQAPQTQKLVDQLILSCLPHRMSVGASIVLVSTANESGV